MKYILKTEKNENDNLVFSKQRNGKSFLYLAKDENGVVAPVDKDWVLKNQKSIINLGIDKNDSIYPVEIKSKKKYSFTISNRDNHFYFSNTKIDSIILYNEEGLFDIKSFVVFKQPSFKIVLDEPVLKKEVHARYDIKDCISTDLNGKSCVLYKSYYGDNILCITEHFFEFDKVDYIIEIGSIEDLKFDKVWYKIIESKKYPIYLKYELLSFSNFFSGTGTDSSENDIRSQLLEFGKDINCLSFDYLVHSLYKTESKVSSLDDYKMCIENCFYNINERLKEIYRRSKRLMEILPNYTENDLKNDCNLLEIGKYEPARNKLRNKLQEYLFKKV